MIEACEMLKIEVEKVFKMADQNFFGQITPEQLKVCIKDVLSNYAEAINFKKFLNAFNLNNQGMITLYEYNVTIQQAIDSDADTSAYHKIV